MRAKVYVGISRDKLTIFRSETTPTMASHGGEYTYAMGPFRTLRGARYYVRYGRGNPHTVTVAQCETLALARKPEARRG